MNLEQNEKNKFLNDWDQAMNAVNDMEKLTGGLRDRSADTVQDNLAEIKKDLTNIQSEVRTW